MINEELIQKVCARRHISVSKSFQAVALYTGGQGLKFLSGYIINDQIFIDERTETVYPIAILAQISNVEQLGY